jgi:hypothetical protein
MALTYGGDLMQYKPVWNQDYKVCVADYGGARQRGRHRPLGRELGIHA